MKTRNVTIRHGTNSKLGQTQRTYWKDEAKRILREMAIYSSMIRIAKATKGSPEFCEKFLVHQRLLRLRPPAQLLAHYAARPSEAERLTSRAQA